MSGFVLDTNHVSASIQKHPVLLRNVASQAPAADLRVALPPVAELWFMVFNSSRQQQNTAELVAILQSLGRCDLSKMPPASLAASKRNFVVQAGRFRTSTFRWPLSPGAEVVPC